MTESGPPPIETGNAPIPRWLVAVGAGIVLVALVVFTGFVFGIDFLFERLFHFITTPGGEGALGTLGGIPSGGA